MKRKYFLVGGAVSILLVSGTAVSLKTDSKSITRSEGTAPSSQTSLPVVKKTVLHTNLDALADDEVHQQVDINKEDSVGQEEVERPVWHTLSGSIAEMSDVLQCSHRLENIYASKDVMLTIRSNESDKGLWFDFLESNDVSTRVEAADTLSYGALSLDVDEREIVREALYKNLSYEPYLSSYSYMTLISFYEILANYSASQEQRQKNKIMLEAHRVISLNEEIAYQQLMRDRGEDYSDYYTDKIDELNEKIAAIYNEFGEGTQFQRTLDQVQQKIIEIGATVDAEMKGAYEAPSAFGSDNIEFEIVEGDMRRCDDAITASRKNNT